MIKLLFFSKKLICMLIININQNISNFYSFDNWKSYND